MNATPGSQQLVLLEQQLDTLANALAADDHAAAAATLQAHEASLGALDLQALDSTARARLHALVDTQQALLQRMHELRENARLQLQGNRHSLRAAQAYLQAESLA